MPTFDYVGTVFDITTITPQGVICFTNPRLGTGMMGYDEFARYFSKTSWTEWIPVYIKEFGQYCYRTNGKRVMVKRYGHEIKACASCHPNDGFALEKGLQLALARLRVKEIKATI